MRISVSPAASWLRRAGRAAGALAGAVALAGGVIAAGPPSVSAATGPAAGRSAPPLGTLTGPADSPCSAQSPCCISGSASSKASFGRCALLLQASTSLVSDSSVRLNISAVTPPCTAVSSSIFPCHHHLLSQQRDLLHLHAIQVPASPLSPSPQLLNHRWPSSCNQLQLLLDCCKLQPSAAARINGSVRIIPPPPFRVCTQLDPIALHAARHMLSLAALLGVSVPSSFALHAHALSATVHICFGRSNSRCLVSDCTTGASIPVVFSSFRRWAGKLHAAR